MSYTIEAILAAKNNLWAMPKDTKKPEKKEKTDAFQVMLDNEINKLRAQK